MKTLADSWRIPLAERYAHPLVIVSTGQRRQRGRGRPGGVLSDCAISPDQTQLR